MADFGFVADRTSPRFLFELSPVRNNLASLCLLGQDMDYISPWVDTTASRLSRDQRGWMERACGVGSIVRDGEPDDFETFLQELETSDPERLRNLQVEQLRFWMRHAGAADIPTASSLIADAEICVAAEEMIHESMKKPFDREQALADWRLKLSGSDFRDRVVAEVREVWQTYLKLEWERTRPILEDTVAAFRSVDYARGTVEEQLKRITERDQIPDEWLRLLSGVRRVVIIPSIHIGPYMLLQDITERAAWIIVHAHAPEDATVSTTRLDRSELLMRLEALSDETRLKILEMAKARDVLTTQIIIDELGLSQSSASRHLLQLTATGLLTVDASERTKRYRINRKRVERVSDELRRLFGQGG